MIKLTSITNSNRNLSYLSKSDKIIETIIEFIRNGDNPVGGALNSVNVAAQYFGVARQNIVRVYEKLKKMEVVESMPRKGCYVINKQPKVKNGIMKLFMILQRYKCCINLSRLKN